MVTLSDAVNIDEVVMGADGQKLTIWKGKKGKLEWVGLAQITQQSQHSMRKLTNLQAEAGTSPGE